MSHVAEIDLLINDLDALDAACKRIGMELRRDQKTWHWYGTSEGDIGVCDHALAVVGSQRAYEVGVRLNADASKGKFSLLYDLYRGGNGLRDKVGEDCNKLKQAYATEVAIKQAKRQGFQVHESLKQDGTVQLRCTK